MFVAERWMHYMVHHSDWKVGGAAGQCHRHEFTPSNFQANTWSELSSAGIGLTLEQVQRHC